MREVTFAAIQYACGAPGSLDAAERLIGEASDAGAQVAVLPALFETPYFCKTQEPKLLGLARPLERNAVVERFATLARETGVVVLAGFYEAAGTVSYDAVAVIDADGTVLGAHRQCHVPQGVGRAERFYFAPADAGFGVWDTAFGRFGVGLGHDAWFPEAARAMALNGADALLYPLAEAEGMTALAVALAGHAAANAMPVVAANRIGDEAQRDIEMTFPGGSMVVSGAGVPLTEPFAEDGFALARVDLDAARDARRAAGLFLDRRPDIYGRIAAM